VWQVSNLIQDEIRQGRERVKAAMVTLTYRPGVEWQPSHVQYFVRHVRQYVKRHFQQRVRYVWVLELTVALVPHYHLVFWLPKGCTLPKPDDRGWWVHGLTRIEWARSGAAYLCKYVSKQVGPIHAGAMPAGARIFGWGGCSRAIVEMVRFKKLPQWAKEQGITLAHDGHRAPGGGVLSRATGEWQPSPYKVVSVGRRGPTLARTGAVAVQFKTV
jgi:hypothetical protein